MSLSQVLILYLSYARCDRWGKLDEGYIGLFFFFFSFWQFLLNLVLHSEEESLGFTPKGFLALRTLRNC